MAAQTPVNGTAHTFYIMLQSMANPGSFQIDPTLAAGDFQISKDGGAFSNLATLPDAEPNGTAAVRVQLSSGEMTADNVVIRGVDQTSPKEWADFACNIQPQAAGPLTAAAVVNEWETQSQADPTGFHVNVLEIGGTAQTANDNGADINTLITSIGTPSDLGSGATVAANLADIEGQTDNLSAIETKIDAIDDLLDTEIGALTTAVADLPTNAELAAGLAAADDDVLTAIAALTSITADDVWDEVLEGSYTARQLMRLFTAALGGIVAGAGTTTITFRNTGDSKDVITATVDANGNRSAVTLDLT